MNKDENGDGNPVQDQPKWWRSGKEKSVKNGGQRDLEGEKMNRNGNAVQDQPKWWRAEKD